MQGTHQFVEAVGLSVVGTLSSTAFSPRKVLPSGHNVTVSWSLDFEPLGLWGRWQYLGIVRVVPSNSVTLPKLEG